MPEYSFGYTGRTIKTEGKPKPRSMDAGEKVTRKRLSKANWDQLNAVTKGTYVNHLGRGHSRRDSALEERKWDFIVWSQCLGCLYGVYYYHTDKCTKRGF